MLLLERQGEIMAVGEEEEVVVDGVDGEDSVFGDFGCVY